MTASSQRLAVSAASRLGVVQSGQVCETNMYGRRGSRRAVGSRCLGSRKLRAQATAAYGLRGPLRSVDLGAAPQARPSGRGSVLRCCACALRSRCRHTVSRSNLVLCSPRFALCFAPPRPARMSRAGGHSKCVGLFGNAVLVAPRWLVLGERNDVGTLQRPQNISLLISRAALKARIRVAVGEAGQRAGVSRVGEGC